MNQIRVGIIVGGGPAPGINAVIGAATIEAVNQGFEVVGFYDGFRWLCAEDFDADIHTTKLAISDVARIHFDGGSILRISRANLLDKDSVSDDTAAQPDQTKLNRVLERFEQLGITHLITIGGDDTALSARFVTEAAGGKIRVAHVPKTIDNDLPLPAEVSTFGFSTARYYGTEIVKNLMQDSLTTGRWYLVTVMGRSSGWLALGVGMSASATVTLLPEEFEPETSIQRIADVLEGAMLKRQAMGRSDGVAVVAEGLAYKLGDRVELERILGKELPVDAAGHIRLSEIPLGYLLRRELEARFHARNQRLAMVTHVLGYELRSADPTPYDMSYCRSLGHGCIQWLLRPDDPEVHGTMITIIRDNLAPIAFDDMIDRRTNRIRVRRVDLTAHWYKVARSYMIRLEESDLSDPEKLQKLATEAGTTPEEFRERFTKAAARVSNKSDV
jgi:ATP-dependent phosphofructokinase / diphosphate-dependent phosphofructokinase